MDTCALYLRVSTDEQAGEGHASLDVQRLRCQEYADAHGWPVAEVYMEAESAFNNGACRPEFQRMVRDATAGKFQHVIVFNASRFSRRATETLGVYDQLERAGVQVHSTAEGLGNFLMRGIQAVINEEQSRRISEGVKPSLQHLAEQGFWPRGHPRPFGFQFAPDRILRHDPTEAPTIRTLFRQYYEGASLGKLAAMGRATKYGPATVTGIRWILRNPLYAGRIRWNGEVYPGKHEAIVEATLFDRVQEMLTGRYQHHEPAIRDYAIAGLLKCGKCGAGLVLERRRGAGRRDLFVCRKDRQDWHMQVPASEAEATVRAAIAALSLNPESLDVLLAEAATQFEQQHAQVKQQRVELERQQRTARERQDRLTTFLLDGTITRETYLRQQPRLEQAFATVARELAALPVPKPFDPVPLRAAVKRMPELIRTGAPAAVHEALRLFLARVEAYVPPGRAAWRDDCLRLVWQATA